MKEENELERIRLRLRDHVHEYQCKRNKKFYENLLNHLSTLSEKQIKIIQKNPYKKIYKKIQPIIHMQQKEVRISWIEEVLHYCCKNQFQQIAKCFYQSRKTIGKDKYQCKPQFMKYQQCILMTGKNVALSSFNLY